MKKSCVYSILIENLTNSGTLESGLVDINNPKECKQEIRKIADNNEAFENAVFELGASQLAKYVSRQNVKNY